MVSDPYPNDLLLRIMEVIGLLRLDRKGFDDFVRENPDFPKPITVGHLPKNKRPRQLYRKEDVYAWIRLKKWD